MRFGLMLNVLDEEYQISIYKGIKKRADELGIQLVSFQQENTKFSSESFISKFSDKDNFAVDGVIFLSSVMIDGYEIENDQDLCKITGNIPVIAVGQKVEGVPSLVVQMDDSMKSLVEHLISEHKYRKFLYIGGPQNHLDAIRRETIFKQTLEAYRPWIPEIEYIIKRGFFAEETAAEVMAEYYEENENSPDCVVCASDTIAIGVYKFFNMHCDNPRIKECAVTGFDDIPQSKFVIPSLTTIHQPLEEIGVSSVDLLNDLVKGKTIPKESFIESNLVLRESCGCKESNQLKENRFQIFEEMQANYLRAEQYLRLVSRVEQDLNYCEEVSGLKNAIDFCVEQFEIADICVLKFVHHKSLDSIQGDFTVHPVYVRRNNRYFYEFYGNRDCNLGDFFRLYMNYDQHQPKFLVFKFLNVGNEIVGCVLYDATEKVLPYIHSISISIGQTLNRIEVYEERKQRSEYLEKEISKRTAELMEANNRRMEVEAEVLKITEIERQRFSMDLHDDICQQLAGISMLCRSYSNRSEAVKKDEMVELAGLIGDTLARTRQYAHNSYPVDLDSLGLQRSLSNLCSSIETQYNIKCIYDYQVPESISLSTIQKLNIFRIIQEALHNVTKHSRATEVQVKLFEQNSCFIVQVSDNGNGLPETKVKTGLGLNSMQYRANQIEANFRIFPNTPKGTCVEISMKTDYNS